ncbi:hypothetical protein B7463_g5997, partial [Scytalidium lignicola]
MVQIPVGFDLPAFIFGGLGCLSSIPVGIKLWTAYYPEGKLAARIAKLRVTRALMEEGERDRRTSPETMATLRELVNTLKYKIATLNRGRFEQGAQISEQEAQILEQGEQIAILERVIAEQTHTIGYVNHATSYLPLPIAQVQRPAATYQANGHRERLLSKDLLPSRSFTFLKVEMSLEPVFSEDTFNIEKCIELHNELVSIGFERSGLDSDDVRLLTWWDVYGDQCDAEGITQKLIPTVINFLKGAQLVDPEFIESNYEYKNLFYYLQNLSIPETILSNRYITDGLDQEPPQYVLLYQVTDIVSHSCGILFNQYTLKVRVAFSIFDTMEDVEMLWVSLQTILQQYLDMVDLGKVTAGEDDTNTDCDSDRESEEEIKGKKDWSPWILHPHSDEILSRTLRAFENLLHAIEDRMPNGISSASGEETTHLNTDVEGRFNQVISDLISNNQLEKDGFITKFLRQAIYLAKSPIQFIAPGIRFLTPDSISNQPFHNIDFHTSPNYNPILLFPMMKTDGSLHTTTFLNKDDIPFSYAYNKDNFAYPCGLWVGDYDLECGDFDDACLLLFPKVMAAGGESEHHLRSTDGFVLGDQDDSSLITGLYQTRCNPFIPSHNVELFRILENWVQLVESGIWEVDECGIVGGIEKWKEANERQEIAKHYRIESTW